MDVAPKPTLPQERHRAGSRLTPQRVVAPTIRFAMSYERCAMTVNPNPLCALSALGQSVWLDYVRRDLIASGELARLVRDDCLRGVTSNPTIFEAAMTRGDAYGEALATRASSSLTAEQIYEQLAIEDIRAAADVLAPEHERTRGRDGFVSLEVAPRLAHDTQATLGEALRLWERIERPNAMIKIPATRAGLPAITGALAHGINVNVTLVFSVERYLAVVDAFQAGLEARIARAEPIDRIASVASFFVSRIDTMVDAMLAARPHAAALRGKLAIASACLAYRRYREWVAAPRWQALAKRGARPQRLLWASTSTKDPAASDVKYVEALIAPNTVNTLPPQTLEAYRDHGEPAPRIDAGIAVADELFERARAAGIDMDAVCEALEDEGVRKFAESYTGLLGKLGARVQALRAGKS